MAKQTNGFSLIEILIVVVVISIISGMTLAYVNDQNDIYKLKNEAEKLIDVFVLTKKRAVTNDKPENCFLNKYAMQFDQINQTYTVTRNISNTETNLSCCSLASPCDDFTKVYAVDKSITFSASTNSIDISPKTGFVNPQNLTVTFRKKAGKCYDVNFSTGSVPVSTANFTCL